MPRSRHDATRILIAVCLLAAPLALTAADPEWAGNSGDAPPQKWHCRCSTPNAGNCWGGNITNENVSLKHYLNFT